MVVVSFKESLRGARSSLLIGSRERGCPSKSGNRATSRLSTALPQPSPSTSCRTGSTEYGVRTASIAKSEAKIWSVLRVYCMSEAGFGFGFGVVSMSVLPWCSLSPTVLL
jgi:hypothetical protein